jgi:hypothetical protein
VTVVPLPEALVTFGFKTARAVYISLSSATPILQPENDWVQRIPVNFALPSVTLPVNPVLLVVADEIALMVSSGISRNDKQVVNMLVMFVTAAVLNSGTDFNDEQLSNMLLMFVTAAVLNSGTDSSERQS